MSNSTDGLSQSPEKRKSASSKIEAISLHSPEETSESIHKETNPCSFGPQIKTLVLQQSTLTACNAAMQKLMDQLRLTLEERDFLIPLFRNEFDRQMPQIITNIGLIALLQLIGERARKNFRSNGLSPENAEDLGQKVTLNIFKTLVGPQGNAGAWVSKIVERVFIDHLRAIEKDKKVMDRAKDERRAVGI